MVHAGSSGCQDRPGPKSSETPVRNQSLPLLIGTTPIKFDKFDKFEFDFTDVGWEFVCLTENTTVYRLPTVYQSTTSAKFQESELGPSPSATVVSGGHLHNFQARFQARWELAVSLQAHCQAIEHKFAKSKI